MATQFVKILDGQTDMEVDVTDRRPMEKRKELRGDLQMNVKFVGVREKDGVGWGNMIGCGRMTSKRQQLRGAEGLSSGQPDGSSASSGPKIQNHFG